jgi:hypothetical protein
VPKTRPSLLSSPPRRAPAQPPSSRPARRTHRTAAGREAPERTSRRRGASCNPLQVRTAQATGEHAHIATSVRVRAPSLHRAPPCPGEVPLPCVSSSGSGHDWRLLCGVPLAVRRPSRFRAFSIARGRARRRGRICFWAGTDPWTLPVRKPITLSAFAGGGWWRGLRLTDAGRRETRGPCGVGLPPSLCPFGGSVAIRFPSEACLFETRRHR